MRIQFIVNTVRQFRSLHKWIGISVALFMLITSTTGLILGWKKNVPALQPVTQKGGSSNLEAWVSLDQIVQAANRAMDSVRHELPEIERLDVRPDKGIVKVIYLNGFWEAQVDGKTGRVLSVAQRHSDWIEHIHDGSFISDGFKLAYTSYTGLSLSLLCLSGFWLWYGPRRIRKLKDSTPV